MKFRAERTEFADAVAWALRTVGSRVTRPGLSGVHLSVADSRLQLSSSNDEMDSRLAIPVQAERDGSALVLGKLLGDVVRTLPPAAIEAEVDGDVLRLACGRARFALRLMAVEDFPMLSEPSPEAATAKMKAEQFARTVAQVARAASIDDARPAWTRGVLLEAGADRLVATATDSYRLAVRTTRWEQGADTTVLVPRRALEEAMRAADQLGSEVTIWLEPGAATFSFGDRRLTTRLISDTFPDYRGLIPSGFERRLTVDRAELTEVVKRVAVVGDAGATVTTPVTLHLSADTVRVTAGTGEVGQAEESLPGEFEGEDLQIAFNPRYLTDGLEAAGGERVVLEFRDELKPAVIRPAPRAEDAVADDDDFLYLLMPVRV